MTLLLKNCRLIPELSDDWTNGLADILIADGTIVRICSAESDLSADKNMDCLGKTVMPGLFDMHMHINWDYLNGALNMNDFDLFIHSCQSAQRYLDCGITTVRDLGSAKRVAIAVRNAIAEGLVKGPRILSGGVIIAPVRRAGKIDEYHFLREVSGLDQMLRAAREEMGEGADFVKLYVNGNPPDMHREEIRTAVNAAHLLDKRVAAHAHYTRSINLCLEEKVDTLEHGTYLDERSIELLKEEHSYLIPTLSVFSPEVLSPGDTPETKKLDAPMFAAAIESVKSAYKAGLKMGLGTDTPIEALQDILGHEIRIRKEYCGMKNVDILLQATKYSALAAGLENITGEIKEGLAADLLVLNGNPDEDISVMYKKPDLVLTAGAVYYPR